VKRLLGFVLALPLSVLAAEPVATAAPLPPAVGSGVAGN
jgi:flagellar protein FliO/FliZ